MEEHAARRTALVPLLIPPPRAPSTVRIRTSASGFAHVAPDLLIIDDFGLRRLDPLQSIDFYDVVIERHRGASTIVTSNRTLEEWASPDFAHTWLS